MRKVLIGFFICAVMLLSFCSCSKDNNTDPVPSVEPTKYSTTLSKVYELDTTKQAPNDTISRWVFTYDNANRLIVNSFTSTSLYRNDTYSTIRTIEYKGSDTTAFRSFHKAFTSVTTSYDTSYYTFANGNYAADTVVYDYGPTSPRGASKESFAYQPGFIIRNFQNWVPIGNTPYATDRQVIYQALSNGDITHQLDTTFSTINGFVQPLQVFETTVSYLPNPNPFAKIYRSIGRKYFDGIGIGTTNPNGFYAPEHLIAQQTSTGGNISYDYTFRADGYPITARVTQVYGSTKTVTKLLFVYTQN